MADHSSGSGRSRPRNVRTDPSVPAVSAKYSSAKMTLSRWRGKYRHHTCKKTSYMPIARYGRSRACRTLR